MGFKNSSPTFQKNVFVMESPKGCSKRPRSEQPLGESQETELLLGTVLPGKADLGCRARNLLLFVCSLCSGKQDSAYVLYDK